jgi:hypothetical protein
MSNNGAYLDGSHCHVLQRCTKMRVNDIFMCTCRVYSLNCDFDCERAGLSACRRILDLQLRDARLGGVALQGPAKARFNQLKQELAVESRTFSQNVQDATKKLKFVVTERDHVDGMKKIEVGSKGVTSPGCECLVMRSCVCT